MNHFGFAPLFLYGTLKRGHENASVVTECGAGARFVRETTTARAYTLVDLGAYPGLRPGGSQMVKGELWLVDDVALERLDEFEGHPTLFRRAEVALCDATRAWAYFVGPQADTGRTIVDGVWRKR